MYRVLIYKDDEEIIEIKDMDDDYIRRFFRQGLDDCHMIKALEALDV